MVTIYHVTPITPKAALGSLLPGRAMMVSFFYPFDTDLIEAGARTVAYDNGRFSTWMAALKSGKEWDESIWDAAPYYEWLAPRLVADRWAIMPDIPGAPSQLNDAALLDWPFPGRGAPVWHMDGPIGRLVDLASRYPRVCLGWIGNPKTQPVGCDEYRARMDEVGKALGNRWPVVHMLRGTAVSRDYPFASADSSSLAQNGWRYDSPIEALCGDPWRGRCAYADRLETAGASRRWRTKAKPAEKPPKALLWPGNVA